MTSNNESRVTAKLTVNEDKGIYPKYIVFKHPGIDIEAVSGTAWSLTSLESRTLQLVDDFTFVLKVTDKHARVALAAYAQSVVDDKPQLAADIREVLSDF